MKFKKNSLLHKNFLRIGILVLAIMVGQSVKCQDWRFGVTVDPQLTWMSSDVSEVEGNGARLGVNIGLEAEKFFAKNYAFSTGLSINSASGSLNYKNLTNIKTNRGDRILLPNSDAIYKLQYITIPLGFKFFTNEIGYITYHAQLGLQTHINIKARLESDKNQISNENISESVSLINAGYFIGAGAQYSLGGNTALRAALVYQNGFIDITEGDDKITLGSLGLRLTIMF